MNTLASSIILAISARHDTLRPLRIYINPFTYSEVALYIINMYLYYNATIYYIELKANCAYI